MSFAAIIEPSRILARVSTLVGGRVYDGLTDAQILAQSGDGLMPKVYIVVEFGEPIVSHSSRSIMDEDMQPYILPVTFTIVGPTAQVCRETAGPLRELLLGWSPSDTGNATTMRLSGGGQFSQKDSTGVPSRFQRVIFAETTINMSAEQTPISA